MLWKCITVDREDDTFALSDMDLSARMRRVFINRACSTHI